MITIQRTVEIPADRRLVLDLPPNVPDGPVNMLLVFSREEPAEKPAAPEDDALRRVLSRKFPTIDELKAEAARKAAERQANPQGDPLLRYAGCLKDSGIFEGDAVAVQRKMRDEWD
jgi:hypothetical protein